MEAPARRAAREVVLVRVHVVPLDRAEDAGHLDVAPLALRLVVRGEVGKRRPDLDALERDVVGVVAAVGARAGPLERDEEFVVPLHRHPADLNVAEERHAGRAPVLDRVREDVRVHERAPRLARADLAELAPGVPETDRRLPGVEPTPKSSNSKIVLTTPSEVGIQPFTPSRLCLTLAQVTPSSPYWFGVGLDLRRPEDVEPVRVHLLEVVAEVGLREAVDLPARALDVDGDSRLLDASVRLDTRRGVLRPCAPRAERERRGAQRERRPPESPLHLHASCGPCPRFT